MAALNPNDLSKFSGILEIRLAGTTGAWTRLPSVRELATIINDTNIVDVKADDTGTVYKATDRIASIQLQLLENANRDNLALLFGGTSTDVAGVLTPVAGEALGTGWTVDTPIKLANKNADNTEVSSITIDADATPLVLNTDYRVFVGSDGYTYIMPITAQAGVLDADYSYTPNVSENLELDLKTIELRNFEIRVTATSEGKARKTIISSGTLNSEYSISYQDVIEAGDITGSTLTFESNKGATYTYENEIL